MRLIELSLQHVRGVTDRTVTFAQTETNPRGVVIVEGPNEAGKTTLRDAFVALINNKASSKTQDIKGLQTVGRDEPPVVTATFLLDGRRFTYRKQFLKRHSTELSVTGDTPVSFTGDEAHEYVTKALDDTLDRGLWQALWLTQRELVDQPKLDDARGLMRVLDQTRGTHAVGMIEHAVVDAARQHYLTFFTEKQGQLRAEFKQRDDAVKAAVAHRDALEAERDAIGNDLQERERLAGEIPRLIAQRDQAKQEHAHAKDAVKAVTALRHDRELVAAERLAATAQRDQIAARIDELERMQHEQQQRAAHIGVLAETHAAYDTKLAAYQAELAAAEQARTAARDARNTSRQHRQTLEQQLTKRRAYDRQLELNNRYQQLVALEAERRGLVAALNDTLEPSVVQHLETLQHAVDVAQIRHTKHAPQIRLHASGDVTVALDGEARTFTAGEQVTRHITEDLTLGVDDLLTIDVTLPKDTGANDLAEAKQALADALATHQVADVHHARAQRYRHHELHTRLTQIDTHYTSLLADDTRAEIEIAAQTAADTDTTVAELDTGTLEQDLAHARQQETADEQALDAAEEHEHELRTRHNQVAAEATETRVNLANAHAEQQRLAEQIARHTAISPEETAAELAAVTATLNALDARQHTLDAELAAAGGDDVDVIAQNAEAVMNDLTEQLLATERRRDQLDTSIRLRGGDGLHEKLAEQHATCETLTAERDAYRHRADVAKRLYDTLEQHRQAAHRRYVAPLYDEILRFGRLLYGPSFDVELTDTLAVGRRHIDGTWLELDQLSAGAQEQLALIARLACARLLGDEGGVVFFDDALGHTDRHRLERLGAVLRLAAEHTQLVVLTCDGDRFRHVGGANRIVL